MRCMADDDDYGDDDDDDGDGMFFEILNCFRNAFWRNAKTDTPSFEILWTGNSVTRLGDLLDFGEVFKALDNN